MNNINEPSSHFEKVKQARILLQKYKICDACERALPKTDEYWYITNGSYRTNCKECLIKKNRAYTVAKRREELMAK